MINLAINTYVHILFVLVIVSCLVIERIILKPKLSWNSLLFLLKVDGIYGLAAIVVVTTGLLNWMNFGKGYDYYAANSLFTLKFSLFIIVGLLSLYPTIWFFKLKKAHKQNPPEEINITNIKKLKRVISLELALMAIIPLLATLMANGIGFWS